MREEGGGERGLVGKIGLLAMAVEGDRSWMSLADNSLVRERRVVASQNLLSVVW